ncbi:uncharacterized protein LOC121240914 [Juglans microcarpa x Juglans regia]|uniref:uncharacterized protein LOC121240914 n=1 Tax=Juglans microcarpa x Juglans regia TaxID=2249226 RepID=UPI001B7DA0BF|nr:uncharacterized protein LOC121240914 [Juglans microcarpa x Juglans regia]
MDEARWLEDGFQQVDNGGVDPEVVQGVEDEGEVLGSILEEEKVESMVHKSKEKDCYSDPVRSGQQRKSARIRSSKRRCQLWQELCGFPSAFEAWVVAGDFNVIRSDAERRGGRPRSAMAMEEFNQFINLGGLKEMSFMGGPFSWCNGHAMLTRCWARLDRILMDNICAMNYPSSCMEYLSCSSLDHAPMVMCLEKPSAHYGPSPFRFQEMWTRHDDFLNCVKMVWEEEAIGIGMWKLVRGSKEDEMAFLAAKLELDEWMRREEMRLSQIAKQRWAEVGDVNAQLFRSLDKKGSNLVREMTLEDGRRLSSPEAVHEEAVRYFSCFMEARNSSSYPDLSLWVHKEISDSEHRRLYELSSIQDIKETMFSIPIDSSPGSDGFTSGFYKSCWGIVEKDVVETVWDFFRGCELPRFYSSSYVVLIPKVPNPTSFEKFKPISLCSMVYKVCSKLMV